jgi:hypothetical protein
VGVVSRAKRRSAYAEKIVIPALAGIQGVDFAGFGFSQRSAQMKG